MALNTYLQLASIQSSSLRPQKDLSLTTRGKTPINDEFDDLGDFGGLALGLRHGISKAHYLRNPRSGIAIPAF